MTSYRSPTRARTTHSAAAAVAAAVAAAAAASASAHAAAGASTSAASVAPSTVASMGGSVAGARTPFSVASAPPTPSSAAGEREQRSVRSSVDQAGYSNMDLLFGNGLADDEPAEDDPDFLPGSDDDGSPPPSEDEDELEDEDDADAASSVGGTSVMDSVTASAAAAEGVARRTRAKHSLAQVALDDLGMTTFFEEDDEFTRQQEQAQGQDQEQEDPDQAPHFAQESIFGGLFSPSPPLPAPVATPVATQPQDDAFDAYNRFKLMLSSGNLDDAEDDDGEFMPGEEAPSSGEEEEYRNDRSVSISKKELRHLKSDRVRNIEAALRPAVVSTRGAMSTRRKEGYLANPALLGHGTMDAAAAASSSFAAPAASIATSDHTLAPVAAAAMAPLPPTGRRSTRATAASAAFASDYSSIPRMKQTAAALAPSSSSANSFLPAADSSHLHLDAPPFAADDPILLGPMQFASSTQLGLADSLSGPASLPPIPPINLFQPGSFLPFMPPFMSPFGMPPFFPSMSFPSLLPPTPKPVPVATPALLPPPTPPPPVAVADWTIEQRALLRAQLGDHVQLLVQLRYLTLNSVLAPQPRPTPPTRKKDDSGEEHKESAHPKRQRPRPLPTEELMSLSQIWDRTTELLQQLVSKRDVAVARWHAASSSAELPSGAEDPFANPASDGGLPRPVLSFLPMLDVWLHLTATDERTRSHTQLMQSQESYIPWRFRQHFTMAGRDRPRRQRHEAEADAADDTSSTERPWSRVTQWYFTPLLYAFLSSDTQSILRQDLHPAIRTITRKSKWQVAEDALLARGYQLFGRGAREAKRGSGILPDWARIRVRFLPGRSIEEIQKHHANLKQEQRAIGLSTSYVMPKEFMVRESDDEMDVEEVCADDEEKDQPEKEQAPPAIAPPAAPASAVTAAAVAAAAAINDPVVAEKFATAMAASAVAVSLPWTPGPGVRGKLRRELSPSELVALRAGMACFGEETTARWASISEKFLPSWDRFELRRAWLRQEKIEAAEAKAKPPKTSSRKPRRSRAKVPVVREEMPCHPALASIMAAYARGELPPVPASHVVSQVPLAISSTRTTSSTKPDEHTVDEVDMTLEEEEEEAAAAAEAHVSVGANALGPVESAMRPVTPTLPAVVATALVVPAVTAAIVGSASPALPALASLLPSSTFSAFPSSAPADAVPAAFDLMEDCGSEDASEGTETPIAPSLVHSTPVKSRRPADEAVPMVIDEESDHDDISAKRVSLAGKPCAGDDDAHLADAIVALKGTEAAAAALPQRSPSKSRALQKTPQKAALLQSSFTALAHSSELVETVPAPLLAPVPQQLAYSAEQYAYASTAAPSAASPSKRPARTNSRHTTPIVLEVPEAFHLRLRQRTPDPLTRATPGTVPTPTAPPPPLGPSTRPPPRSARVLAETTMRLALPGASSSTAAIAAAAAAATAFSPINDSLQVSRQMLSAQGLQVRSTVSALEVPPHATTARASVVHLPPVATGQPPAKKQRTEMDAHASAPEAGVAPWLPSELRTMVAVAKLQGIVVDKWSADVLTPILTATDHPPRLIAEVQAKLRALLQALAARK